MTNPFLTNEEYYKRKKNGTLAPGFNPASEYRFALKDLDAWHLWGWAWERPIGAATLHELRKVVTWSDSKIRRSINALCEAGFAYRVITYDGVKNSFPRVWILPFGLPIPEELRTTEGIEAKDFDPWLKSILGLATNDSEKSGQKHIFSYEDMCNEMREDNSKISQNDLTPGGVENPVLHQSDLTDSLKYTLKGKKKESQSSPFFNEFEYLDDEIKTLELLTVDGAVISAKQDDQLLNSDPLKTYIVYLLDFLGQKNSAANRTVLAKWAAKFNNPVVLLRTLRHMCYALDAGILKKPLTFGLRELKSFSREALAASRSSYQKAQREITIIDPGSSRYFSSRDRTLLEEENKLLKDKIDLEMGLAALGINWKLENYRLPWVIRRAEQEGADFELRPEETTYIFGELFSSDVWISKFLSPEMSELCKQLLGMSQAELNANLIERKMALYEEIEKYRLWNYPKTLSTQQVI